MSGMKKSIGKYIVRLSDEERDYLEPLIRKGSNSAGQLSKARILLKADASRAGPGWGDRRIAEAFEVSLSTVQRLRQRFVEQGFEAALNRKPQENPPIARIFDGAREAQLIQLACSEPPAGHARWSLRLLEKKVVELGIVEAASDSTIGRVLKKTSSSRTGANAG